MSISRKVGQTGNRGIAASKPTNKRHLRRFEARLMENGSRRVNRRQWRSKRREEEKKLDFENSKCREKKTTLTFIIVTCCSCPDDVNGSKTVRLSHHTAPEPYGTVTCEPISSRGRRRIATE